MPAQEMHVLANLRDPALSPWYSSDVAGELETRSGHSAEMN